MKVLSYLDIKRILLPGTVLQVTHSAKGAYTTKRIRRVRSVTPREIMLTALESNTDVGFATLENVIPRIGEADGLTCITITDAQQRQLARWLIVATPSRDIAQPYMAMAVVDKAKPGEHVGARYYLGLDLDGAQKEFDNSMTELFLHMQYGWLGEKVVERPPDPAPCEGEHQEVLDALNPHHDHDET